MESIVSSLTAALPLGSRTRYRDQVVFLNVHATGSVLGIEISQITSDAVTSPLLQTTFLGIHDFEAGLCIDEHAGALLLTQWIPGAKSWADVPDQLDRLVLQACVWQGSGDASSEIESHRYQLNFDEMQVRDRLMSISANTNMKRS